MLTKFMQQIFVEGMKYKHILAMPRTKKRKKKKRILEGNAPKCQSIYISMVELWVIIFHSPNVLILLSILLKIFFVYF